MNPILIKIKYINTIYTYFNTLIPCILDIALKGRSALKVRMVLKAWTPPAPASAATKLMSETFM